MAEPPDDPPEHTPADLVAALIAARLSGDDEAAAAILSLAAPGDDGGD